MNESSAKAFGEAHQALAEGNGRRAVDILEQLAKSDDGNAAEAQYRLGRIYHIGTDLAADLENAERHYLSAEESNHEMASYWLARLYQNRRNFRRALDRYRKIVSRNPSAGYWIYNILTDSPELKLRNGEAEESLKLAIQQGHIFAMRRDVFDRIKGKKGPFAIPAGCLDLFRWQVVVWKYYWNIAEGSNEIADLRRI